MTAAAIEVACPKCGGEMYDNRGPNKKNPKGPDFKCKAYKEGCEGVIWPPRSGVPKATPPKPAPQYVANKPNAELPPLLQNAAEEDTAELAAKIGFDITPIQKQLSLYTALTEFVLRDIAPIYERAKIGMSPESAAACAQTLYINISGGKK